MIFARKIHSVFVKLILSKNKIKENKNTLNKFYRPGKKISFLNYHLGKTTWIEGIIEKRIGKMMFLIKHPKWKVRRNTNQIKKKFTPDTNHRGEELMSMIYDVFEVPRP